MTDKQILDTIHRGSNREWGALKNLALHNRFMHKRIKKVVEDQIAKFHVTCEIYQDWQIWCERVASRPPSSWAA